MEKGNTVIIGQNQYEQADEIIEKERKESILRKISAAGFEQFLQRNGGEKTEVPKTRLNRIGERLGIKENSKPLYEEEVEFRNAEIEKAVEVMKEFRKKSFYAASEEYKANRKDREFLDQLLDLTIKETTKPGEISDRNTETDSIRKYINACNKEAESFANKSPEAAYIEEGIEFRKNIKELHDNRLVRTPYVQKQIERVEKNIASGTPTLILGHLGCGKTEMALEAVRESSINLAAQKEAENALVAAGLDKASREERAEFLAKEKHKNITDINCRINRGDPEAIDRFTPLLISGSKDLTTQDLFSEKTLQLESHAKDILQAEREIDAAMEKWREDNSGKLNSLSPKDRSEMEYNRRTEIATLYAQNNNAYGTVVKTVEKGIIRGMKEGRPVIIDEGNAIMPAVLISLNDILQRGKKGNIVSVSGQPVKVQEGFAIIMTGNESSDRIRYGGTNELNAAFRSRFDVMQYDYLPQNTEGGIERENPQSDELFRVVMSYLADEQHGNIQIPEKDKNLDKLFALCQLAKMTQKIFSDQQDDSAFYNEIRTDSGDNIDMRLETSVLSIRNIVSVLKDWGKGAEKDLDKALWDAFIAGVGTPSEQKLTIQLAKYVGFFRQEEGWSGDIPEGDRYILFEDLYPGKYDHQMQDMETITEKEVLSMVFGEHVRVEYPEDINFNLDDEIFKDTEVTNETIEEIESKMQLFKDEIAALEVLAEQCGCSTEEG